jgi:hypothetical protein
MFVLISGMWRVTVDGVSLFVNAAVCLCYNDLFSSALASV